MSKFSIEFEQLEGRINAKPSKQLTLGELFDASRHLTRWSIAECKSAGLVTDGKNHFVEIMREFLNEFEVKEEGEETP